MLPIGKAGGIIACMAAADPEPVTKVVLGVIGALLLAAGSAVANDAAHDAYSWVKEKFN